MYYVDYEEDLDLWGVFHIDTGFCYSLHYTEQEAKNKLAYMVIHE